MKDEIIVKCIAVVETPLHLFNLMVLLQSRSFVNKWADSSILVDLVIIQQFEIDESLNESLSNTGLFNKVIIVKPWYEMSKWRPALATLHRCIFKSGHANAVRAHLANNIDSSDYSLLIAGCASIYAMDIKKAVASDAFTVFYEEGEGSYLGNFVKSTATYDREILIRSKSRVRKILSSALYVMDGFNLIFKARQLWLYRPDLVHEGLYRKNISLCRLELPSGQDRDLITNALAVGAYNCSNYNKWIFLGNPDVDLSDSDKNTVRNLILDIANLIPSPMQVRLHPRSSGNYFFDNDNIEIDNSHELWEVKCLNGSIDGESVLFGFGSTAQINPSRMFGFEPYLVFLHRLLGPSIDRDYSEKCYLNTKVKYDNPEKVFCPTSISELKESISKICCGNYE